MENNTPFEKKFANENQERNVFTKDIEQSVISVLEIFYFILQKKMMFFVSFVIITAISSFFFFRIPDYYIANASFIPPSPDIVTTYSDNLLSAASPEAQFSLSPKLSLNDPVQIFVEILKSNLVMQYIINKFNLMAEFNAEFNEDALKRLDNMVVVKSNNGLLEISVKYKDPNMAAKIANAFIERLSFILNQISLSEVKKGRVFLEKRLAEIHNKLIIANTNLKNFKVSKKMVEPEDQSRMIVSNVTEIKSKIFALELELDSLKTTYTDNSPKVKAINAQLQALKVELNNKIYGKGIPINPKNPDDVVSFMDIPGLGDDYTELKRDSVIFEQVFLLLTKEYELTKLKEAKDALSLKIIDNAIVPDKKANLSIESKIGIIIFMSFFLALGIVLIWYMLTRINNFSQENYSILASLKSEIKKEFVFWK